MDTQNSLILQENLKRQSSPSEKRSSKEAIEICLAFDRNFVQHAAVTLLSATRALCPDEKLIVHVLQAGDISSADREAFAKVSPKSIIHWHQVDAERFDKLPDNRDHVSLATYLRLFIPELLGEKSSRVIYLDCDTIVTDRLIKLWGQSFDGSPIAAAPDEGGLTQAKRLDFDGDGFYFNAGVLVFDLDKINPKEFLRSVEEIVADETIDLELQDQDILNLVFKEKTHRLDLRWNANTRLYTPDDIQPTYSQEEALDAATAPGIIHFTDRKKPWHTNCNHPLRYLYWELRNQTPWKEGFFKRILRQLKNALRDKFSKSRKAVNRVW